MDWSGFGVGDALIIALLGIVIVFVVLALIILMIYVQSWLCKPKKAQIAQEEVDMLDESVSEDELVAAIMASVSLVLEKENELSGTDTEFVIKKITRTKSKQLKL